MGAWLMWGLGGIGLTYFIVESALCAVVRVAMAKRSMLLLVLMYCYSCMGFWVGAALGSCGAFPSDAQWYVQAVQSGFCLMAVTGSWAVWKGGNPAYALEQKTDDETTER